MSREDLRAVSKQDIPRDHRMLLSLLAEKTNVPEKSFFMAYLYTEEKQIPAFIAVMQQLLREVEDGLIEPNEGDTVPVNRFVIGNAHEQVKECLKN